MTADDPGKAILDQFIQKLCDHFYESPSPSYGTLVKISRNLYRYYPSTPPRDLHPLSKSSICDMLNGRLKSLPTVEFLASFILSLQVFRWLYSDGELDRSVLKAWQAERTAAMRQIKDLTARRQPPPLSAPIIADYAGSGELPAPSTATRRVPATGLPSVVQELVFNLGPAGEKIMEGLLESRPDAYYHAGLLLAAYPEHARLGENLLRDAAADHHQQALEIMRTYRANYTLLGQHARSLGDAAAQQGDNILAHAFFESAVQCGMLSPLAIEPSPEDAS